MSRESLARNIQHVRERVARAARAAGRDVAGVTLVAVSKRVPASLVAEALELGIDELGESRVQETLERLDVLRRARVLHLVGHLQTNKAGRAVDTYDLIHSVDSERLARAIDRRADAIDKRQDILIEVNTSGETSKHGIAAGELGALVDVISGLDHLRLRGLMTIGPLAGGEAGARRSFAELRALLEPASRGVGDPSAVDVLSMGMSGDFEIAIEEGATHVRVGTAIFGPREVPVARAKGGDQA